MRRVGGVSTPSCPASLLRLESYGAAFRVTQDAQGFAPRI